MNSAAFSPRPRLLFALAATALFVLAVIIGVSSWALVARNVLLPLVDWILLGWYFWGWGAIARRVPGLRSADEPPDPLFVLGLGVAVAIVFAFLLGSVGLLRPPILTGVILVVAFVGAKLDSPFAPRFCCLESSGFPGSVLRFFVKSWLVLLTLFSLLPDRSWDTLAYHLAMGKIFLRSGRLEYLPWMFHSNFPIAGDLFSLHGLAFGGERVAVLLSVFATALAAWACFRVGRSFLSPNKSGLMTLLFLVSPVVAEQAGTCLVEMIWTAFALLALAAVLEWRKGAREIDSFLHLAAIFAGLAAATKISGVLSAAAIGCIVVVSLPKKTLWVNRLAPAARFVSVGLVSAIAPYLKSWIQTGTPVWPLTFGTFHVPNWNERIHERFVSISRAEWAPFAPTPGGIARGVWENISERRDVYLLSLVLFLLVAILRRRRLQIVWPLGIFAFAHFLFWCLVTQQSRFLLPALPAAIAGLFLMLGPESENENGVPRARLVHRTSILALSCLFAVLSAGAWRAKWSSLGDALAILRGRISREAILERSPLYRASKKSSAIVPPDGRILLFEENRGYDLDRNYLWGDPINQIVVDYAPMSSVGDLSRKLAALGVTHVLVGPYDFGDSYYDFHTVSLMKELLAGRKAALVETPYRLYDLRSPGGGEGFEIAASSTRSPAFRAERLLEPPMARDTIGPEDGWVSRVDPSPETPEQLVVFFGASRTIRRIQLTGPSNPDLAISAFRMERDQEGRFVEIPETRIDEQKRITNWGFDFPPIATSKIRLVVTSARGGAARLARISVW